MILSFRHKGLERFFKLGTKAGIQAVHAGRLRMILAVLDNAKRLEDVTALRGLRAHPLVGADRGFTSMWVNGNWRVTFKFIGEDVELVDYRDYH